MLSFEGRKFCYLIIWRLMARYEHLQIYKAGFDLAVYIEQIVAGFSHYHKYTLGTELRTLSHNALLRHRPLYEMFVISDDDSQGKGRV